MADANRARVVLLTTALGYAANMMTMSWHMMVEFEAPLVACVVSNSNYSFTGLRATKECESPFQRWNRAQGCGNRQLLRRDVDKFERFR